MGPVPTIIIDSFGQLIAADRLAEAFLGFDNFSDLKITDLFDESSHLPEIQQGNINQCEATMIVSGSRVSLHSTAMNTADGPNYVVSLLGIKHSLQKSAGQSQQDHQAAIPTHTSASDHFDSQLANASANSFRQPATAIDLAEYSPNGLVLLTEKFEFETANAAFFSMTGLSRVEAHGRGWLAALPLDTSQELAKSVGSADWSSTDEIEKECLIVNKPGEQRWIRVVGRQVNDSSPYKRGYVLTFQDINHRKNADERNEKLASFDSLTGLPNRRAFESTLAECIVQNSPVRSILAVFFIDLDGFKQINDSYGHDAGDQLLKKIALTISKSSARATKVARLGGDEFTILLTDVKRIEEVKHFASRLTLMLQESVSIEGVKTEVSASIGIAMHHKLLHDRRSTDRIVNDLLRHADAAMYAAKSAGKNCYRFYGAYDDASMNRRSLRDTDSLIKEVSRAVSGDDIFVEYQPQVDTRTGQIVSCEALIRWHHPKEGLIGPASFVPLVESSGGMGELTIWLISKICSDFRNSFIEYRHASNSDKELSVSVNLSPAQLQDKNILLAIDQIICNESLKPENFIFEITERTLIADPIGGHDGVKWLHSRGYKVALDDFGTGYSSLSYLHRFPLDEIKLDGSFIKDVKTSKASRTIVRSVVELAHSLGLLVTAEGVELESQLEFLQEIGCDKWQGFLMSAATRPVEFLKVVRSHSDNSDTKLALA